MEMTKRMKAFLTCGICATAIFSLSVVFLLSYSVYSLNKSKRDESRIIDEYSSWCTGKRYIYYDLDTELLNISPNKTFMNYSKIIKNSFDDVYSFKKSWPFLYKGDCIYFSGLEKTNDANERYCIYKTYESFSEIKRIATIGITDNASDIKCSYGFENYGYFKVNSEYIVFNFDNETIKKVDSLDEEKVLNGEDKYLELLRIERSKCKTTKDGVCEFYYGEELSTFDENYIDVNYLNAMKKYSFKISWQISFPSGLTTFVYRRNVWLSDCVLVSYNRNTHSVIDYQLFTGVSGALELSHLYPDIDLLGDIG